MDKYTIDRNKKIDVILDVLYKLENKSISFTDCSKEQIVLCRKPELVDYLIDEEIVQVYTNSKTQAIKIELTYQGKEIVERYGSWSKYFKKVILRNEKTENAKKLANRFWWLPIFISLASLGIALIALFKK